jgi:hypothetical protein
MRRRTPLRDERGGQRERRKRHLRHTEAAPGVSQNGCCVHPHGGFPRGAIRRSWLGGSLARSHST